MNLAASKSKLLLLGGLVAFILIIILLFALGSKPKPAPQEPISLNFWGVYDDSDIYADAIKAFKSTRSQLSINYKKIPPDEYQKTILEGLASGKGPDIIMIPNGDLFQNKKILTPMPPCIVYSKIYQNFMALGDANIPPIPPKTYKNNCEYTSSSFKKELYKNILKNYQATFVDVAFDDFVSEGLVYGMPLYVDTLALFYNKDHFYSANIAQPPSTWREFVDVVRKLRRINSDGLIERAAVALGDIDTIHRAVDIFLLLAMQRGASLIDLNNRNVTFTESKITPQGETITPVIDALNFYLAFGNPKAQILGIGDVYTWNNRQNYSIDAFVGGKVSMIFDYAYKIPDIKNKNAYLNFAVAPMPQLEPNPQKIVNYADYFGVAVTNKVLDQTKQGNKICGARCKTAWEFLIFLTSKENSKIYSQKSFRPVARKDLVAFQGNDLELGVFANQSLTAKSWQRPNKALVEQIILEAVKDVLKGNDSAFKAFKKVEDKIKVLIPPLGAR